MVRLLLKRNLVTITLRNLQTLVTSVTDTTIKSWLIEVSRFRFLRNRDSGSLTIFGNFYGIGAGIVVQRNRKRIEKGIVFRFTIPHLGER